MFIEIGEHIICLPNIVRISPGDGGFIVFFLSGEKLTLSVAHGMELRNFLLNN